MGAFDAELSKLGYRFYMKREVPVPSDYAERTAAVAAMHLATMPCPGSCGKVCPNHYCPAHNKEPYEPKKENARLPR